MAGRIAVGVIRKPHGIRGEASIEAWTSSPDRFSELSAVTLVSPDERETRPATIETTRAHGGRALIKFAGIESPEDLRAIQNWTIEIPESEARQLDENEYFLHDLEGLMLVDTDGRERGVVTEVYEGGGGLLLSVKGPRGAFDVPFASEICTAVDLVQRRITVNFPAGLDDLDDVAD